MLGHQKIQKEVHKSGMADPIIPMNRQAEKATQALFTAYGREGMMKLKTNVAHVA